MNRRSVLFALLFFPVLNWWIALPKPREVRIAVIGPLKDVMTEIAHYYETRNSFTKVKLTFASAEEVARQLENKIPYDVVIGGDDDMDLLESKSLLIKDSQLKLTMNQVVAVAQNDTDWDITEAKQLSPDNVKRIALTKETTKSGKMARDYLQKYGVLDALKDKITEVKSAKGAIDSVKSGESKWTFTYSMEATKRKSLKVLWKVPPEELAPVIYSVARPVTSADPEVSSRAITALQSSIVRRFFENAGLVPLTPAPDNRPK